MTNRRTFLRKSAGAIVAAPLAALATGKPVRSLQMEPSPMNPDAPEIIQGGFLVPAEFTAEMHRLMRGTAITARWEFPKRDPGDVFEHTGPKIS